MKIYYVLGACAIMVAMIVGFLLLNKPDNTMAGMIYPATFHNLIGTRIASTTTAVGFYRYGTSTYPFALFGATEASVVFDPITASTSAQGGSAIYFSLLGSNDPGCDTATTTTIFNLLTLDKIRWFDAMSFDAMSYSVTTGFSNGTSTIAWINPSIGAQREIHLTGLNMNCLAVQVTASSTSLYVQHKLQ